MVCSGARRAGAPAALLAVCTLGPHDDRPPPWRAGGPFGERVRVSISRDIERYAGLFASRTKVMTSSAMRDLMAITARPEVISLAGGLPDTSPFPPDTFAAVAQRIAA